MMFEGWGGVRGAGGMRREGRSGMIQPLASTAELVSLTAGLHSPKIDYIRIAAPRGAVIRLAASRAGHVNDRAGRSIAGGRLSSAEKGCWLLNVNRRLNKHRRSLVNNGLGVNHRCGGSYGLQSAQKQHIRVCHARKSQDHSTDCRQQCFHTAPFEFDAAGFENLHLCGMRARNSEIEAIASWVLRSKTRCGLAIVLTSKPGRNVFSFSE